MFVSLLDQYPNGSNDNKILDNHKKAMEIKFNCRGDGKNLTIVVFSPRNYILYFQTIISGRVDDYFSVLYLDKSKFSLYLGDKASTYSY